MFLGELCKVWFLVVVCCACVLSEVCVSPNSLRSDLISLPFSSCKYTPTSQKKGYFLSHNERNIWKHFACRIYKMEQFFFIYLICLAKWNLWQLRLLQQLLKSHILTREWDIAIASDLTLLSDPAFDLYTHTEAHDFLWLCEVATTMI